MGRFTRNQTFLDMELDPKKIFEEFFLVIFSTRPILEVNNHLQLTRIMCVIHYTTPLQAYTFSVFNRSI